MENKLNEIVNAGIEIETSLDTIDGQMAFLSHLIQDVEKYRDGMALMLKHGELEKQLNAIYMLFHYELERIKESNSSIFAMLHQYGYEENTPNSKNQG